MRLLFINKNVAPSVILIKIIINKKIMPLIIEQSNDLSCMKVVSQQHFHFQLDLRKCWQQKRKERDPCSCCARPLLSQQGNRFNIYQKLRRANLFGNLSQEWSYGNNHLIEHYFQILLREQYFHQESLISFYVNFLTTN